MTNQSMFAFDVPEAPVTEKSQTNPWWKRGPDALFRQRVEEALPSLSKKNSGQVLENRNTTVGGSDIGGCMRRVVLDKRNPSEHGYKTLAKFFRGHRQEEFNAPVHRHIAFEDGVYWTPQLRVNLQANPRIRAHIDNVYYVSPTGKVEHATSMCIVEEKNAKELPNEPHEAHVEQLHFQMGLLKDNYPQAEIFGLVYGTDLNGEHTDFDNLFTYDETESRRLFDRAEILIGHIDAGTVASPEPSVLCGFCKHISDCPSWHKGEIPPAEYVERIARYEEITSLIRNLDAEKKLLKTEIVQTLTTAERPWYKSEVDQGLFVQISSKPGRETCSVKNLKEVAPALAKKMVKQGDPSTTLRVFRPH